jgi:hypothetical protein
LIGVAACGVIVQVLAGLVLGTATEPAVFGAALAPDTVAPTATPVPSTMAAAMAA